MTLSGQWRVDSGQTGFATDTPHGPSYATSRAANIGNSPPESPAHQKLRRAAEEFEGMLIAQLLGEAKMGFSSLGGDSPLAGSETLNSLAIQTLSNAMARRGGLGIAQMLVRQLEPSLRR